MEDHAILSERLEDQLKAIEWAKAEQKKILNEKGERFSKELNTKDRRNLHESNKSITNQSHSNR